MDLPIESPREPEMNSAESARLLALPPAERVLAYFAWHSEQIDRIDRSPGAEAFWAARAEEKRLEHLAIRECFARHAHMIVDSEADQPSTPQDAIAAPDER